MKCQAILSSVKNVLCIFLQWDLPLLMIVLTTSGPIMAQSYSLSGYVEDALSRERIPRVNVYLIEERSGTSSNEFGYFT